MLHSNSIATVDGVTVVLRNIPITELGAKLLWNFGDSDWRLLGM